MQRDKVVALAMPQRSGLDNRAAMAYYSFPCNEDIELVYLVSETSIISTNCNVLFKNALNMRRGHKLTHFAMLHSDMGACRNWLSILFDELAATGADMVSAVVPIKDSRGLTSTAVEDMQDDWNPRRLTMHEAAKLPETFTLADIPWPEAKDSKLLLNTGCMLIDFTKPFWENVWFQQDDRIVTIDGEFYNESRSEDWNFSRMAIAAGAKLAATRKVQIEHERPEFHNRTAWGTWQTDMSFAEKIRQRNLDSQAKAG